MDCTIFQSPEWEEFKLRTGYGKSYRISGVLVLQKKLPLGRTMLYSPMVSKHQLDSIQNTDGSVKKEFFDEINKIEKENNSIFYRLELNQPETVICYLLSVGFKKSFEEMQPEHNWLLNLSQTEEEILCGMKQKGRYNIKIAQKNEIKTTSSIDPKSKELNAFYSQYIKTGKRHNVSYREKKYFEALLDILREKEYAKAYTAWHGDIPLASAIMIFFGRSALYLYGASSDEHKNLMAPYLLHWEIMREAKTRGYKEYNFLGVSPDDSEDHPWAGITRFKKQFGGYEANIMGSYDLPLRPIEYQVFKIAEKIRRH